MNQLTCSLKILKKFLETFGNPIHKLYGSDIFANFLKTFLIN